MSWSHNQAADGFGQCDLQHGGGPLDANLLLLVGLESLICHADHLSTMLHCCHQPQGLRRAHGCSKVPDCVGQQRGEGLVNGMDDGLVVGLGGLRGLF